MKKFITLALALILVLSMTVCVFAEATGEETNTGGSPSTVPVTGTYSYNPAVDNISVLIEWKDAAWTYTVNDGTWDEDNLTYVGDSKGWSNGTTEGKTTITVTNRSNVKVSVNAEATALANGVTATLDGAIENVATDTLESAVGKQESTLDSVTFKLGISGSINASGEIATVTLTVGKAQ